MPIEAVSFFIVDVIHHASDFMIIQISKGTVLGTDVTYIPVVLFTGSFRPEAVWITVKNSCAFTSITEFFHLFRDREFRTAIRKNNWKQLFNRFLIQVRFQAIQRLSVHTPDSDIPKGT